MPIDLTELQQASQSGTTFAVTGVRTFTPKFFNSKLTGVGAKTGILNEMTNPTNVKNPPAMTVEHLQTKKLTFTNGNTTVISIPVNILNPSSWKRMNMLRLSSTAKLAKLAEKTVQNQTISVYAGMKPHSLIIEEKTDPASGGTHITRTLTACYQCFLFRQSDNTDTAYQQMDSIKSCFSPNPGASIGQLNTKNGFYTWFACAPIGTFNSNMQEISNLGYFVDAQAHLDFLTNYSLYQGMTDRAEEWQTTIHEFLDQFFDNVKNYHSTNNMVLNEVAMTLRALENYTIPLDLYREIYKSVQAKFPKDVATILCKQNLNLLLSDQLNDLSVNKANLTKLNPNPAVQPKGPIKFSLEQQKAITSTDPLTLVQSGAGTGKSSVILGRVDYMVANGVKPEDITVLSFTNAAADHIKEKNPNIHSMTIASMIHSIYALNFPTHELSSTDTIINTLDIYYKNNPLVDKFKEYLKALRKQDNNSYTTMNNFIEAYYTDIIGILDYIRQTSLELEIIICYQQIENLQEPPEVQSKFLIIDEVQDNSIFEFIYAIKYVAKHKESLFIVGDCSQTLYEFRASNPKALNVLEGSGVFKAFQLQTNYRSNQEILDFANVALQNIEANQYAHIQLQANSLTPVTETSFRSKVTLHYERLNKLKDFGNRFVTSIMGNIIRPYVAKCIAAGEQVAFLAYKRYHVNLFQQAIQKAFPNATVVSLVPEKTFNSTIFSKFIKEFWDQITFSPTGNIVGMIQQTIIQKLPKLVPAPDKALIAVQSMLYKWQVECAHEINSYQAQLQTGAINMNQFMDAVKENMLGYEIRSNAVRQRLLSAQNDQQKRKNAEMQADIVVSTIHSAKGLEFDHTVILYQNENAMSEENKRMYYVALTRAKKSELVLAYDTVTKPRIQLDYDTILKILHARAIAAGQVMPAAKPVAMPRSHTMGNNPDEEIRVPTESMDTFPVILHDIPDLNKTYQEQNPDIPDLPECEDSDDPYGDIDDETLARYLDEQGT